MVEKETHKSCSISSRALVCLRTLGLLTSSPDVITLTLSRLMGDAAIRLKKGSREGSLASLVWFTRMYSSSATSRSGFSKFS